MTQQTIEQLSFVSRMERTPDHCTAQYRIDSERSVLDMDDELHEIEQHGYEVKAISQVGHGGLSVYVDQR